MEVIRKLRAAFPKRTLIADMKIADTGAMEVEMAAKAGADIVVVLGSADDSTVLEALRAAKKYGARIMADLISSPEPVSRAKELEQMGVDIIAVHSGIDQQMMGRDSLTVLMEVLREIKVPVAVAGGLDVDSCARAAKAGASVLIVGGNIVRSSDVTSSARAIRNGIDAPLVTSHSEKSRDDEIRDIFMAVSTPNISDAMHRKGAMQDIFTQVPGRKMVGTAVTVQTFKGDWAKAVEAIDAASPGDVLVIYNGSRHVAPWGGLATRSSLNKGIAGVVIDGAVRDIDDIRNMTLPVFATCNVPNAGEPKGFGEINAEIVCGNQTVRPGDYIIGDDNGVVVVPRERAYEIARRSMEVEKNEQRLTEEIRRGATLSEVMQLKKWEKQ